MIRARSLFAAWWPYAALFLLFFWPMLTLQKSFTLGDYAAQHLPSAILTFQYAREGTLPFWTNAIAGGFPSFAEGLGAPLYFVHWIGYRVMPMMLVYTWSFPLHFFAAAIGMALYTRRLGLSERASMWAAACFCFSSAYAGCLFSVVALQVLTWLPWQLWLLERSRSGGRREQFSGLAALSFLIAQQWFAGFAQMAAYTFAYLILHELLALRERKDLRSAALLAASLLCGTMIAWPQVSASLELLGQSLREGAGAGFALWGSVPPTAIAGLFYPQWGNALRVSFYLGVLPLLFALSVFLLPKEKSAMRHFWVAAAFFLFALGQYNPAYRILVEGLGIGFLRNPGKFLVFALSALSVLSAYGYDALDASHEKKKVSPLGVRILVLTAALAVSLPGLAQILLGGFRSLWPAFSEWYVSTVIASKGALAKSPSYYQGIMDAFFAALPDLLSYRNPFNIEAVLLIIASAFLWVGYACSRIHKRAFHFLAALILIGDLGLFGLQLSTGFIGNVGPIDAIQPTAVQRDLIRRSEEAPGLLAEVTQDPANALFQPNTGLIYNVRHAGGYSPLLLKNYYELVYDLGILDGSLGFARVSKGSLEEQRGVLDLIGARYVRTDFPLELEGMSLLDPSNGTYLYENERALPGVAGFYSWRVIEDRSERLKAIKSAAFSPSVEALLADPRLAGNLQPSKFSSAVPDFQMLADSRADRLHFKATMAVDGIAMLRMNAYPGWTLSVDGMREEWGIIDHAFLGFGLKNGMHDVLLRYEPTGWALSWKIALAGACLAFLPACSLLVRRRA